MTRITSSPERCPRAGRQVLLALGWLAVAAVGPAFSCPGATPPPALPLPVTADPPPAGGIRAVATAGGGVTSAWGGDAYGGAAVRGVYSPLKGMLVGVAFGGGGLRQKGEETTALAATDWLLASRVMVGYGHYLYRRLLSVSGEIGLTTGLHNENGGFVGPDFTLAFTAGTAKWFAITAAYRFAYMIPSRKVSWDDTIHHLVALTVLVPRHTRYGFVFQAGIDYGSLQESEEDLFGFALIAGFRFTYDLMD